jgi:hypothetical protein
MKIIEQISKVRPNHIPERLVELSWEAIRARSFIVFHLENNFSYFILSIRRSEKVILHIRNPMDIICSRLIQREVTILRSSK